MEHRTWNNKTKKEGGFTLLELFVSIFIITVGVVAILSALLASVSVTFFSSSRLVAAYLAQEGIEIVRNIRETNWLEIHKGLKSPDEWDDGIICCGTSPCECEADYVTTALTTWADPGRYLYIDGTTGFYRYISVPSSSDTQTLFRRKITVNKESADELKVLVYIFWQERGKNFQMLVQEKLYDWK